MRIFLTLLLTLYTLQLTYGSPRKNSFQKLLSVNQQWNNQADVRPDALPDIVENDHRQLIHKHLSLVEVFLRERDVSHLSVEQRRKRTLVLDLLHDYTESRAYPINESYAFRTPIFIDDYGNYCAVGHLIKMTGFDAFAQDVRRSNNLVYIKEIRDERLYRWAETYGITIDELAWIQPGYDPTKKAEDVQGGTNKRVYKLFPKDERLYFVGDFTSSGDDVPTWGIGFLEPEGDSEYAYGYLGTGVTGSVRTIVEFEDQLVLGGSMGYDDASFDQAVVYWNGTEWLPMGCLKGMVKELVTYEGSLYAVGDFQLCAEEGISEGNFVSFNGEDWQLITGIEDSINTAMVFDGEIYLGGYFQIDGALHNIAKWHPETGFSTFSMDIIQEINDFEIAWDQLYAAGRQRDETDLSYLLIKCEGGIWTPVIPTFTEEYYLGRNYDLPVNIESIRFVDDELFGVGDLQVFQPIGNACSHNFVLYEGAESYSCIDFVVDSTIRDITKWDDKYFVGGDFAYTNWEEPANRLAYITSISSGISPFSSIRISVYPNPANHRLFIQGLNGDAEVKLYNVLAQEIWYGNLQNGNRSIDVSNLLPGNYFLVLQDEKGGFGRYGVTIVR